MLLRNTLATLRLTHQTFLLLIVHTWLSFHSHFFKKPAGLTDILRNNHHILRYHCNFSSQVLFVYLNLCDKCLLMHITQASSLLPKSCSVFTSLIYLEYYLRLCIHQSYQYSIIRLSYTSINGTTSAALYNCNQSPTAVRPFFEQF